MERENSNNIRKDELMAVGRHGDSRREDEASQASGMENTHTASNF